MKTKSKMKSSNRLRTGVHQSLFVRAVAEGNQSAASSSRSFLWVVWFLFLLVAVEIQAQPASPPTDINSVRYQTTKVDAVEIFYDIGHFALEDKHAEIAALMGDFLGRKLTR